MTTPSISNAWDFMYEATPAEPPTGSEVRFDNADLTLATKAWIKDLSVDGTDARNALILAGEGGALYLQDKDAAANWQAFSITGAAVGKTGYVEIPVAWSRGSGVVPEQRVRVSMITPLQLPG